MMSRDLSGVQFLENVQHVFVSLAFYIDRWIDTHAVFCVINVGLHLGAWRFCSSVPSAIGEAKRGTVEPLENMN